MMGGGRGGGAGMGSMFSAYGAGVKPQGGPSQPLQAQQQQPFRQNQPGPATAQSIQAQPQQVNQPQQSQPWGIIGTDNDTSHGYSATAGKMAGNAARASSLQTAISNFHQAQSLGNQTPPQSTQAKGAQRQPQSNLAQLSRQLQADTASESAAQQYQSNPNYQWASQQQVNPANVSDMNNAENYVNQNAHTPAATFGGQEPGEVDPSVMQSMNRQGMWGNGG